MLITADKGTGLENAPMCCFGVHVKMWSFNLKDLLEY